MTHAMGQGGPGDGGGGCGGGKAGGDARPTDALVLTEGEVAMVKALRWLDSHGRRQGWMLNVSPVPVHAMNPADDDGPEVPESMVWIELPSERVNGKSRRPLRSHATHADVRVAIVECLRSAVKERRVG